jgi:hypothetical protein
MMWETEHGSSGCIDRRGLWCRAPHDRHRADAVLATGDAGVTRILRHAHGAFHTGGLCPGNVAGDTLNLGVVEAVAHDLVVRAEPSEVRAYRAGGAAFGATEDPLGEERNDQKDSCSENDSDPFHETALSEPGVAIQHAGLVE